MKHQKLLSLSLSLSSPSFPLFMHSYYKKWKNVFDYMLECVTIQYITEEDVNFKHHYDEMDDDDQVKQFKLFCCLMNDELLLLMFEENE